MSLRGRGLRDMRLLRALEAVSREAFFPRLGPAALYADSPLPLPQGQTALSPHFLASLIDAAQFQPDHRVLEIGTGSGYQTAVIAHLVRRIYTIERHRDLSLAAQAGFAKLGLHNIAPRIADGWTGWPEQAPFDRILATAALPTMPLTLAGQLKPEGVLIAAVCVPPAGPKQRLMRITRKEAGLAHTLLAENVALPLLEKGPAGRPAPRQPAAAQPPFAKPGQRGL